MSTAIVIIEFLVILSLLTNPTPQALEENMILSQSNETTATKLLMSLPEPKEKIPIAVYEVLDKTGQFKEDNNIGNSRIVTQGATEMLITALVRSHQFAVLDRVQFQHILNEQNLRLQNRLSPGEAAKVGVLTGAKYIIEGAITEYNVDMVIEGLGLKITGIGASGKNAKASCAIDLRLTDTTSGEVIWAKSFKKEILGQRIGLTAFTFMGTSIVEFETGQGRQEVINLVVRTLLEEAVYELCKDILIH
ncbi:MAG: CsgG/HfaB family protein [bacterium]